MSIMVGATTHKFLMIAAAMCLPARVNRERVEAVIDDHFPVSVISTQLAGRLHIENRSAGSTPIRLQRPVRISIGAEGFSLETVVIADAAFGEGAHRGKDLILGDDMFRHQLLEIDFATRRLRLILPYERDHHIRNLHPVAVTKDPEGQPHLRVSFDGATPTEALLDLGSETPITIDAGSVDRILPGRQIDKNAAGTTIESVVLGDVSVHDTPAVLERGWITSLPVKIGFGIFRDIVILDMDHDTIWLSKS